MELTFEMFLLFGIGLLATFIGTLGGSGGFINLPAMMALGIPIHTAIASNKFANTFSSFTSFITLFRQKAIAGKALLFFIPFSLTGGIFGAIFASSLKPQTMQRVAIVLLVIAFVLTYRQKGEKRTVSHHVKLPIPLYPIQMGFSFYDGMLGPGQATMQMIVFQHYQLSYLTSIALTRMNTFFSCIGAFATYYLAGLFSWSVGIPLALGGVIGARMALIVARKLSQQQALYLLRSLTLVLLGYMVVGQIT
ncbi:sulfite exporter TauE/SafE family protein [Rubeoparvulum massiliense]|uniref:sulfite exporter TauE/SafE family protein n=1 Tax=Rubeoparvulum massiliense TaxID=1631346 RepID=UPI0009E22847|nr:sulfite exporter TauE/SafE family protein [Rubeoparvulum massiliense]